MIASEITMGIGRGPACRRAETRVSIIRLFDSPPVRITRMESDCGSYPTFTHSALQSGVALSPANVSVFMF